MQPPNDVAGVRRISGNVNYLAKFLPHLSEVSEPLRWDCTHDQAFPTIKHLITEPPVLKYYEPACPLVLQCDAIVITAWVQHSSRTKSPSPLPAERWPTPNEITPKSKKELPAIVYGTTRFHRSLSHGRNRSQAPGNDISKTPFHCSKRLQKMLMGLHYDLNIQCRKGSQMYLADTLSRHHLENTNNVKGTRTYTIEDRNWGTRTSHHFTIEDRN
jgi:hypothetical protein